MRLKEERQGRELSRQDYEDVIRLQQSGLEMFFYDDASEIGGYLEWCIKTPTGAVAEISLTPTADDEEMEQWASPVGCPAVTFISAGTIFVHFHAYKTLAGAKETRIYFKIYKRVLAGTETLIGTTNQSNALIATSLEYDVHAGILDTEMLVTDRLVIKVFAGLSGGGANPTIKVEVEGTGGTATFTRGSFPGIPASNALAIYKAEKHFEIIPSCNALAQDITTSGNGNVYEVNGKFVHGTTSKARKSEYQFQLPGNYVEGEDVIVIFEYVTGQIGANKIDSETLIKQITPGAATNNIFNTPGTWSPNTTANQLSVKEITGSGTNLLQGDTILAHIRCDDVDATHLVYDTSCTLKVPVSGRIST